MFNSFKKNGQTQVEKYITIFLKLIRNFYSINVTKWFSSKSYKVFIFLKKLKIPIKCPNLF